MLGPAKHHGIDKSGDGGMPSRPVIFAQYLEQAPGCRLQRSGFIEHRRPAQAIILSRRRAISAPARGRDVGTLAIGKAGAINAGLLAASILSLSDEGLAERLKAWRQRQTDSVANDPQG